MFFRHLTMLLGSGLLVSGLLAAGALTGCAGNPPAPRAIEAANIQRSAYVIGAGDVLSVFVWRNPEVSAEAPVRPDGYISLPLLDDVRAVGKTPRQLADELAKSLTEYVQDPKGQRRRAFVPRQFRSPGAGDRRSRAARRQFPYMANMTALDAMISVGGLTKFAAGNRAVVLRTNPDGTQARFNVRLADVLKSGEIEENVPLLPGDVLFIPQTVF